MLSLLAGIVAVLLMFALYPVHYNYQAATYMSNAFFNAQRVGHLPPDNSVPWRADALTYETGVRPCSGVLYPLHPCRAFLLRQLHSTLLSPSVRQLQTMN